MRVSVKYALTFLNIKSVIHVYTLRVHVTYSICGFTIPFIRVYLR